MVLNDNKTFLKKKKNAISLIFSIGLDVKHNQ